MARNGAGTYSLPEAAFVYDTVISETAINSNLSDIATALTGSIAANGETTITANLPMNSKKLTGLAVGTATGDSVTLGQAQAEAFITCGTAGGTANALTLSPSPAITAYAIGQRFRFIAGAANNTSTVTFAVSGLATIAGQVNGAACAADEIVAGKFYEIWLDTTSTAQITRLGGMSAFGQSLVDDAAASNARTTLGLGTAATATVGIASGNVMQVNQAQTSTSIASGIVALGTTLNHFVTGTENITGFTGVAGATYRILMGSSGYDLVDSAGLSILQTSGTANITMASLDHYYVFMSSSNQCQILFYQRANGTALAVAAATSNSVLVNTANGYGSTNTYIRRLTNTVVNTGSDITYADSAANGASFTINTSGVYSISYNDQFNTASAFLGISLNSTQLTTAIGSINVADILCAARASDTNQPTCVSATVYIAAGGVVRPHTSGHATGAQTTLCQFSISRVS